MLQAPLNSQNERIYRAVNVKTDINETDLLREVDKQQPSIMCYGAVSWFGKTPLYFIEGYAANQDGIPNYRKKKKTVNQVVYRDEMCPQMFQAINLVTPDHWTWQQDGAKAHTALATVAWLQENTPNLITPPEWPSKSPDLNVMDYSIWSLLLSEVQSQRSQINSIEMLKDVLTEAWNNISLEIIQSATSAWTRRLHRCVAANGGHFEHY